MGLHPFIGAPGGAPVPNPFMWFDASKIAQANNSAVSSWSDLSGNGRNLSQATSTLQPTFVTSGINSKGSVNFSQASFAQAMSTASLTLAQPFTCSVVLLQSDTTQDTVWTNAAQNVNMQVRLSGSLKWAVYANGTDVIVGGTFSSGTATLLTAVFNGNSSSSFLRQDRSQVGTGATGIPGTRGFSAEAFTVGQFNGKVGEMFFYASALVAGDITTLETYLHNKWGTP